MGGRRVEAIVLGLLATVALLLSACSGADGAQERGAGGLTGGGPSRTTAPRPAGPLPTGPMPTGPLPTVDEPGSDIYTPPPTEPPPSPSSVPTTTTTTTAPPPPDVLSGDVAFDTGSAELKPAATPELERVARGIRRDFPPSALIRITGHTDSRGSDTENHDLSRRRAAAVMVWFVSDGFSEGRLSVRGAGESDLLRPDVDGAGNFIESAGQLNRRVEIQVFP